MQHVLDARNIEAREVHPDLFCSAHPVPPEIRKVGHVLDLDSLQPGDLILSSPHSKSNPLTRGISYVQGEGGYLPQDARWTHAAVYLGEWFLTCEATRAGVGVGNLLDCMLHSALRVRRGWHNDQYLDRENGWRTALFSATRLEDPYDLGHAGQLGKLAKAGGFARYQRKPPKDSGKPEATICSELFQDAYCRATGVLVQNCLSREVTPAFLSATAMLKDVPCCWRKLAA